MSDTTHAEQDKDKRALSREWLVAQIVVLGGLVVAVIAVVWFGWAQPYIERQRAIATAKEHMKETAEAARQLCVSGLASAKNFGIVPPYGQLYGSNLYTTSIQGRYVCVAATHATKYLIAVDLYCRNFKDARCVSLFSVAQGDGTVLYRRQN